MTTPGLSNEDIQAELWDVVSAAYTEKEAGVGREFFRLPDDLRPQLVAPEKLADVAIATPTNRPAVAGRAVLEPISRSIMLQVVDAQWKDHLYSLDHLKEGIGLRGYGQRDPLVEYKKESFALFQGMKERIDEEMVRYLWRLRPVISAEPGYVGPGRRGTRRRSPPAGARRVVAAALVADLQRRQTAGPLTRLCGRRRRRAVARAGARRRRRRASEDGASRRAEGRPQRSVSVRQREE